LSPFFQAYKMNTSPIRHQILRFRRFIHKSYAAFNSLHKSVSIGKLSAGLCDLALKKNSSAGLLAVLLTSLLSFGLQASDTEDPALALDLDSVRITATPPLSFPAHQRAVYSIGHLQTTHFPAQHFNEVLDALPGLDLRQRGQQGVQADLSMRGGSFDQVLVLLNGINITDPQTGHYNLDLPVDLAAIERIDVLQGSSLSLSGSPAFSGAINILTGYSGKNRLRVELGLGQYGWDQRSLHLQQKQKQWHVNASWSQARSSGYIKNTDYNRHNLFVQLQAPALNSGNWNIQLGLQQKEYGANKFYSLLYPDQFEATQTLLSSLSWNKLLNNYKASAAAYFRLHSDRFELFRQSTSAPAWYSSHNYHLSDVSGLDLKLSRYGTAGKSMIGLNIRNEHIVSTVLGQPMEKSRTSAFLPDSIAYTHSAGRLGLILFAEQQFSGPNYSSSVGLSVNKYAGYSTRICAEAAFAYLFSDNSRLFVNAQRSLRYPSFTDLYYKSPVQVSNPNLKPETAYNAETGFSYNDRRLQARISLFGRLGSNIIDWVKQADEEVWHSMNHSRVNAAGAEALISWKPQKHLRLLESSYTFTILDKEAGTLMSKYALDYLKHKFNTRLEHTIYKNFAASWHFSAQQRMGTYNDTEGTLQTYRPFCLLDGRLFWSRKELTLYLEAGNLFNTKYYDYGGILQPGRWLRAGIRIQLNQDLL
jgi:vitamin B12 transporter